MSVGYEKATEKVAAIVEQVMREHHAELMDNGVTVQVLLAHKYDEDGEPEPAMKTRGQVILAKVSITNLQDRVRGLPDAKLVIDRHFGWEGLANSRRVALIDHELTHLRLAVDSYGITKKDDCGRPKLRIRHHDWELTGFAEVAERHGEASVEVAEMVRWQEKWGQLALFPLKGTEKVSKENGIHA